MSTVATDGPRRAIIRPANSASSSTCSPPGRRWCRGIYYALIGLWPWLNADSFLWATDQKADPWLVQTVGLLMAVIGVTLGIAGARREESWAVCWLGLGSIAALAFCDIYFVSPGSGLVDPPDRRRDPGRAGCAVVPALADAVGRFHPEAHA